ncbi:hypothetical protein [Paenibacillus abyssi]|uniref:Uncharacterized protein n=1 Tax=Paenibacillus abyssi TaxID=1340531 RepID=A0A917G235_9BACL|nr:hypothetical protein [Paenibacillus abyssi]GGG18319.1 hypothetical protein GCM10010916_38960 [Paenibacillus abyssi]
MKSVVVSDTLFEQRVYFSRHEIYKTRNTIDRILYHVGLEWAPENGRGSYSNSELPPTDDKGTAKMTFPGKDMYKALQHAESLSRKYNLPVRLSL